MTSYDPVTLEILWQRLIAIADEMASIVVRASFSTVVGAANDFGCEVMDVEGRSLAHATRSMPAFNRTLPNVTRALIARYGRENFRPGDVFIANDPWLNAGHHFDIAVMTPFFRQGRVMGIAGSIAHVADVGGILDGNAARESYEEGLLIPICRLFQEGKLDQTVEDFIAANVRVPEMTLGDIHAQVAACRAGGEKILELMDEYGIDELTPLAQVIQARAETAMRRAITAVPSGVYRSRIFVDEFDKRLHIDCRLDVKGDELWLDFEGTSPQQPRGGINVPWVFSLAYATYGLKCILLPDVPANAGCYRPFHLSAPEGSILNARAPASVRMRSRTAWHIHRSLFAALEEVLPDRIMAAPGYQSALTVYAKARDGAPTYHSWFFAGGGIGAGAVSDGLSACIYPSSAANVPVELFEVAVPILVEEKEFLPDSAGPGRQQGGLGQRISFRLLEGFDGHAIVAVALHGQNEPAFGVQGGGEGRVAELFVDGRALNRAEKVASAGALILDRAETLVTIDTSGGGGFGPATERDPDLVLSDLRYGLLTPEGAARLYGLAPTASVLPSSTGADNLTDPSILRPVVTDSADEGGFSPPETRDATRVPEDVGGGYVSVEEAKGT